MPWRVHPREGHRVRRTSASRGARAVQVARSGSPSSSRSWAAATRATAWTGELSEPSRSAAARSGPPPSGGRPAGRRAAPRRVPPRRRAPGRELLAHRPSGSGSAANRQGRARARARPTEVIGQVRGLDRQVERTLGAGERARRARDGPALPGPNRSPGPRRAPEWRSRSRCRGRARASGGRRASPGHGDRPAGERGGPGLAVGESRSHLGGERGGRLVALRELGERAWWD